MKTIRTLLLLGCLTAVSGLARSQDFEGHVLQRTVTIGGEDAYELLGDELFADDPTDVAELLMRIDPDELLASGSAEVESLRISIRGERTRVEPEWDGPPQAYQIIDSGTGTVWMVNVRDRSFVELTRESAEEMRQKAREMMEKMGMDPDEMTDEEEGESEVGGWESTGRSAEINGFRATAFAFTDEERIEVAWCAQDRTGLFEAMERKAADSAFYSDEEDEEDGSECPHGTIAIRTVSLDRYGQELVADDVIEIEADSLSASLFEIPSGFKKKDYKEGLFGW